MSETALVVLIILGAVNVGLLIILTALAVRKSAAPNQSIEPQINSLKENQERMERTVKDEIAQNRQELNKSLNSGLNTFMNQISALTQSNEQKLEKMRETVEKRLESLQADNAQRLEQMRVTVDEKLHSTLERRLGESFQMVSDRLELVHKGLGEMQTLASGVGDLKKVLTNVKTRGTWGEIQLGNLLEQILTPEQYAKNVATKNNCNERVEFAIKLPGRDMNDKPCWLPIDAKFPLADYQRLVEAQDQANLSLIEELGKLLENRIKSEAKDIKEKYIDPPQTTDFGILFLPVEGLYAEVLRRPGLFEFLQREYQVTLTGPTTLAALLNSLQMGFRTLVIEKRSQEVWTVLGMVKTEFGKFGEILDKTHKKLQEASNTIEDASKKTRTIERKLRDVQELPLLEGEPKQPGLIAEADNQNDS